MKLSDEKKKIIKIVMEKRGKVKEIKRIRSKG
jgi:hypothetical protein